jgi:hypothetical protein
MVRVSRRVFLLSTAAMSAGCASRRLGVNGQAVAAPGASTPGAGGAPVRQPAVGQSWHYAKHDLVTHRHIDDEIDRINAIGATVDIESVSEEAQRAPNDSWGASWLSKYIPHREASGGPLPSEVQEPWGSVLVDPHWSQVQVYETPIPLWPKQLRVGWQEHVNTRYKTPTNETGLPWDQTIKAHAWEVITVPAGQFKTLRFTNMINFRSTDFSRTDSQRQETVWFAPEVGRWVARESAGTYYMDDSAVDTPYYESSYRWELLKWS